MSSSPFLTPVSGSAGSSVQPPVPSFAQECRDTLTLALPLIAGQLGQMLMGVADTVMVGRVGVVELGASTLANTLLSVPYVLGIGLFTSVSVRISNARGAARVDEGRDALRHGTWLALAFGCLVLLVVLLGTPHLGLLGQPAEVTARTPAYLLLMAASLIPAMLSMVWKNHADALNHAWPPFWILTGGVLLNIGLNWLWIWGHWGFPALGLEGAACGTLAARTVTAVAMLVWLHRSPAVSKWLPTRWFARCRSESFGSLLKIGGPASLQLLTEVCAFAATALIIGTLGTAALAAHQVALTCAATAFMVPLGVSMAMTVRIGELAGAGERVRMHRVLVGGWGFGVAFMCVTAAMFLFAGEWLAREFVVEPAVISLAAQLLVVAGVFQLVDGFQVVSAGALRGVGDVRVPVLIALVAYWVIALPVGAFFSRGLHWGAVGMWTGLATGLAVASLALGVRSWQRLSPAAAQ